MPMDADDVLLLFCSLSRSHGMKVVVKHCGRGTLLAGATAFIGGLMGGPPGILLGGAVGGLCGALMNTKELKPVADILMKLPPNEKKILSDEAFVILRHLHWNVFLELLCLVKEDPTLEQKLIDILEKYLCKQLRAEIQYGE
ncbi:PREDICTED: protein C19orf12 homolog [Pterocles gutturalis]|uniref:Protein C19orf12 n=1 Tax=Pterocles gutturalis TaxID=240206 RepID=A0AAW3DGE9_9AVES|nr:PREDICTED: protein C19orf12 homolog [Pterocles gutturalis]KFU97545.1 Protein C19orf12 [Pterocles gutturalis]